MITKIRTGFLLLALLVALAARDLIAAGPLDDGLLDPAWFGRADVAFHKVKNIDYLWVKPGFTVNGHKLAIQDWADPTLLGKKRDAKDSAKAVDVTEAMPGRLRGALMASLAGIAEVSRKEGDIAISGRIVDCNAGSKAAKWLVGMGAGSASATWDMKLVDAATGEVVVAIHHRAISGTTMSDIDDKIIKWLEELGEALKGDLGKLYDSGKTAAR